MIYIAIPIYSDPFLHPHHKNNKLSLLYIREIHGNDVDNWDSSKSYILPQKHPDSKEYKVDYSFLMDDNIIVMTPDAKKFTTGFYRKNLNIKIWEKNRETSNRYWNRVYKKVKKIFGHQQ